MQCSLSRFRLSTWLLAVLSLAVLAGCASGKAQMNALERAQYNYSAAIRWDDFEGAWNLVDPEYRKAHPMTDLQLERFKQIKISSYRDMASEVGPATAAREIQIGVTNRHNMAERTVRYTETWRYDADSKGWYVTGGLPDFWAGE